MTSGSAPAGGDDRPVDPGEPAAGLERPLSRPGWRTREVENVEPEDIVVDTTRRFDVDPVSPWDVIGDVTLAREVGRPTVGAGNQTGAHKWTDLAAIDEGFVSFDSNLITSSTADAPPGAARTPMESRSLRADAPESVRPGQRFAVSAQLLCAPADAAGTAVDLRPFSVPSGGRQVTVDLHISGGLKALSDTTRHLTILPGQDADPVRFELQAESPGPASVTLRVFALPADYLGQLRLAIPISDAVAGRHRTVESGPLQIGATSPRSAVLEVDVDPRQGLLSFQLRGPGEIGVQRRTTVALAEAVESIALGLQRKLDQVAKGAAGLSPKAVEALLRGTGADLWQLLLPSSIKDLLLRNLPYLDALVFIGADDPIPWELLFPVIAGRPQTFLADQLLLARWTFDAASPKLAVGAGAICYVLPDAAPPAAQSEILLLEALIGRGKRVGTLDALLDELTEAAFGLLHFAAHNVVSSDLPASAWVKLDQPFQQGMLGADRINAFGKTAPLVFMNACNSGAGSPLWVGSTGWAGRFLAAGAGAFVGSLWQVRDGPAKDFAASFYGELHAGNTLGAAFQAARRSVGKDGDPTRLGYTLFGNAAATLAVSRGEGS